MIVNVGAAVTCSADSAGKPSLPACIDGPAPGREV